MACGSGEPLVAHTWTSSDGLKWAEMEQSLPSARFVAAYARNKTLYALGGSAVTDGDAVGNVWTAPLPEIARPAAGVTPVRETGQPVDCGPVEPSPSPLPS